MEDEVRTCRHCGCTDMDCSQCIELTGQPCSWADDDVCSTCDKYMGKFVTAKLKGKDEPRQGWVININPLIIKGQTGTRYTCDGSYTPTIVENPPKMNLKNKY